MVNISFTVAIPGRSLPDGNKAKCFKHFLVLFKMKMSRQLAIEQAVNAFSGVFLERFALRISQFAGLEIILLSLSIQLFMPCVWETGWELP